MENLRRAEQINSERRFQTDVVHSGRAGRSYFDISQEQLNYFLNYQFSVPDIARAILANLAWLRPSVRSYIEGDQECIVA